MLDRHKVQRIAAERMAPSTRCLSRHGCMLCHKVQHIDAILNLDRSEEEEEEEEEEFYKLRPGNKTDHLCLSWQ